MSTRVSHHAEAQGSFILYTTQDAGITLSVRTSNARSCLEQVHWRMGRVRRPMIDFYKDKHLCPKDLDIVFDFRFMMSST